MAITSTLSPLAKSLQRSQQSQMANAPFMASKPRSVAEVVSQAVSNPPARLRDVTPGLPANQTPTTQLYSHANPAAAPPPVTAPPAITTNTDNPYTQPGADLIAAQPGALLSHKVRERFPGLGGEGAYAMASPYAGLANALFLLQNGNGGGDGSKDQFIDFANAYIDSLLTPGQSYDFGSAWDALSNPTADSPLESYLAVTDPQQQVNNTMALARAITNASLNPLIGESVLNRLNRESMAYLDSAARGNPGTFVSYLPTVANIGNLIPR